MADFQLQSRPERLVYRLDRLFDRAFGRAGNPLRQLGAVGFHLFWAVSVSGIYVYVFYDTSVTGALTSLQALERDQPWVGVAMRGLHRYASDALVLVVLLHLVREWMLGRFRGFRWFTWLSGIPLLWLIAAVGLVGYWLVWDQAAAWLAGAALEWTAALPGLGDGLVRNAVAPENVTDRLFSLLMFLHIGLSLLILLGMWIHIQRLAVPATRPERKLGIVLLAALTLLALAYPAPLDAPADVLRIDGALAIDWFYAAALPAGVGAPIATWAVVAATTLLLLALPWMPGAPRRPAPATVDLANCNGCGRCFADCPYGAVLMVPRADGRAHRVQARVESQLCAACGICAGACPSATPFRSVAMLVSGIDMPDRSVQQLRREMTTALENGADTLAFGCERGADLRKLDIPGLAALSLSCAGQLAPAFIDYALRNGAAAVVIASCSPVQCAFRLGADWTRERLAGRREPALRSGVDSERVMLAVADRGDEAPLGDRIEAFRGRLGIAVRADRGAAGPGRARPRSDLRGHA